MSKTQNYISQKNLSAIYRNKDRTRGNEEVGKRKGSGDINKSIFLSHSHLDKTVVGKVSTLLKRLEADIYVDWLDEAMPQSTNQLTAQMIKEKINSCTKFLFLATYHGIRSKWCLWELGLADTIKGTHNIAVLPIESNSGNWEGNEYLQIYPEMKFKTQNLEDLMEEEVFIKNSSSEMSLKNWLTI